MSSFVRYTWVIAIAALGLLEKVGKVVTVEGLEVRGLVTWLVESGLFAISLSRWVIMMVGSEDHMATLVVETASGNVGMKDWRCL